MAQTLKNLPAMQEMGVRSPGQEDSLEKEMAAHSSILAWRISLTEEPGGLQSMGLQRVGHSWAANTVNSKQKGLVSWKEPWDPFGFPGGSEGKASAYNSGVAGDLGSISELGSSLGVGHGNPLQYSCLENLTDRGAWRATVHSVTKSQLKLTDNFTLLPLFWD